MADSFALDVSKIKLSVPFRHSLNQGSETFFTQPLSYDGNELYMISPWFKSSGVSYSNIFEKSKPEMLVRLSKDMKKAFTDIENEAIKQFYIPSDFIVPTGTTKESLFKYIPDVNNLFVKLSPECMIYDTSFKNINKKDLSFGNYRVVLHVVGVYIGNMQQCRGKMASLTVRISQIQFVPIHNPCLFQQGNQNVLNFDTESANVAPVAADVPTATAIVDAPSEKPTKATRRPRRPKLQRQNAIEVDNDVDNLFSKDMLDQVLNDL